MTETKLNSSLLTTWVIFKCVERIPSIVSLLLYIIMWMSHRCAAKLLSTMPPMFQIIKMLTLPFFIAELQTLHLCMTIGSWNLIRDVIVHTASWTATVTCVDLQLLPAIRTFLRVLGTEYANILRSPITLEYFYALVLGTTMLVPFLRVTA